MLVLPASSLGLVVVWGYAGYAGFKFWTTARPHCACPLYSTSVNHRHTRIVMGACWCRQTVAQLRRSLKEQEENANTVKKAFSVELEAERCRIASDAAAAAKLASGGTFAKGCLAFSGMVRNPAFLSTLVWKWPDVHVAHPRPTLPPMSLPRTPSPPQYKRRKHEGRNRPESKCSEMCFSTNGSQGTN